MDGKIKSSACVQSWALYISPGEIKKKDRNSKKSIEEI